jgi:hypothetical protein
MTRLRIASLFVAVVAGDYAALMLIDGQLIDFGVAAAICAGSSVAAGLIAYADDEDARRLHELGRRRRKAVTRGRAAVWENRDQQAATAPDQQCPLCGGAHQTLSDSPRFVDRQGARSCGDACRPSTQSQRDEAVAGVGASSDRRATRTGAPRDGEPRLGITWDQFGWRVALPDDPGVEVLT